LRFKLSEAENQSADPAAHSPAEMDGAAPGKILTPEAKRALAEAAERRAQAEQAQLAHEEGGPSGPEPTRFGDWERGGRAVDF
jgi:hypothetical protein